MLGVKNRTKRYENIAVQRKWSTLQKSNTLTLTLLVTAFSQFAHFQPFSHVLNSSSKKKVYYWFAFA